MIPQLSFTNWLAKCNEDIKKSEYCIMSDMNISLITIKESLAFQTYQTRCNNNVPFHPSPFCIHSSRRHLDWSLILREWKKRDGVHACHCESQGIIPMSLRGQSCQCGVIIKTEALHSRLVGPTGDLFDISSKFQLITISQPISSRHI